MPEAGGGTHCKGRFNGLNLNFSVMAKIKSAKQMGANTKPLMARTLGDLQALHIEAKRFWTDTFTSLTWATKLALIRLPCQIISGYHRISHVMQYMFTFH